MTDAIPVLWPKSISVATLSPRAILKVQESALEKMTKGLLRGRLRTVEAGDQLVHHLEVQAPGLHDYRQSIVSASHGRGRSYPVTVEAESFYPTPFDGDESVNDEGLKPNERRAWTDEAFIGLLSQALGSVEALALIQSLIAQINDQNEAKAAG